MFTETLALDPFALGGRNVLGGPDGETLTEPANHRPTINVPMPLAADYAVFMLGDAMHPRFHDGELLYFSRTRTPEVDDDVLVKLRDGTCLLAQMTARNEQTITCTQYNRAGEHVLDLADVTCVDVFVLRTEILMGDGRWLAGPVAPLSDDTEILALFRRWLDVGCEMDTADDDDEVVFDALCDLQDEIRVAIYRLKAGSARDLAVKVFLDAHEGRARWTPSVNQLRPHCEDDLRDLTDGQASLLRDAAALVPEIGELAAAAIHEDAALIDADMEITWCRKALTGSGSGSTDWRRKIQAQFAALLASVANTPARTPRGEAIKAAHAYDCPAPQPERTALLKAGEPLAGGGRQDDADAPLTDVERRLLELLANRIPHYEWLKPCLRDDALTVMERQAVEEGARKMGLIP